ncbi:MAG: hypothetical protein Q8L23_07945 [Caulobacter sp.]|nr:hypothetical protein [Caulobacter sp.]
MDRRLFLLSTLALTACAPLGPRRQPLVCDRGLGETLTRAWAAFGEDGRLDITEATAPELLDRAEGTRSAVVVTGQALLANRLQRLGHVRLEHRWETSAGERKISILVTKGGGLPQWRALRFARWLASEAARPHLKPKMPILFTVP